MAVLKAMAARDVIWPPTVLAASVVVDTIKLMADAEVVGPVISSPAGKKILCAPGAKSAVPVVQTMVVRVAAVIKQEARVAVPDAGTRTPEGSALPVK